MLPRSSDEAAVPSRSRSRNGMRYVKNEDLNLTPIAAKIQSVKYEPEAKFGPRVLLKLAMKGETYFWGVTTKKNPNYNFLEQQFGHDENDWIGQEILLGLEQDEFTEQYFPRVTFPDGSAKEVSGKRKNR